MRAKSLREVKKEADFLSPYLARFGDMRHLTKDQAKQIKDDCIEDFKQTSVKRANSLLKDFKICNDELEKLQSTLAQVNTAKHTL